MKPAVTSKELSSQTTRSPQGCLCCGCADLRGETTVVSPFVANRAWGGNPELTRVMFCARCGFRFFDRGLSLEEAGNYYAGYRDDRYFRERNAFEPFYTAKVYRGILEWAESANRRTALSHALKLAGAPQSFAAALDYGGGRGQMLLDLQAGKKAVFDLDEGATEPGITRICGGESLDGGWDLVLTCQVLEHLTDPLSAVMDMARMLSPGGWLYAEVPDEIWSNWACSGALRDAWLTWLVKRRFVLVAADCLSTACRIKSGVLPPMGFVPMREHLNYFTIEALRRLLERCGLSVEWSGMNLENSICAVARRQ